MGVDLTVVGADRVGSSLGTLAVSLGRLETAAGEAARIGLAAARSRAPVDSGRLRGSGRVGVAGSDGIVQFNAPYAGPIHWGWRARGITASLFAIDGVTDTKSRWTDVYRDAIQELCDGVEGK